MMEDWGGLMVGNRRIWFIPRDIYFPVDFEIYHVRIPRLILLCIIEFFCGYWIKLRINHKELGKIYYFKKFI